MRARKKTCSIERGFRATTMDPESAHSLYLTGDAVFTLKTSKSSFNTPPTNAHAHANAKQSPPFLFNRPENADQDDEQFIDILDCLNQCSTVMPPLRRPLSIVAGCVCKAADAFVSVGSGEATKTRMIKSSSWMRRRMRRRRRMSGWHKRIRISCDDDNSDDDDDDDDDEEQNMDDDEDEEQNMNDEDEEEDEDDSFTLAQLLKTIRLFEKKPPTPRSMVIVRKLVALYKGDQDEEERHIHQVLEYLTSTDLGLLEIGLQTAKQLASGSAANTAAMLRVDVLDSLFTMLHSYQYSRLHKLVARVIDEIVLHRSLLPLWHGAVGEPGVRSLVLGASPRHARVTASCAMAPAVRDAAVLDVTIPDVMVQDVTVQRQACASVLRTLAGVPEYTQLVACFAMPAIADFPVLNTHCQALYSEILCQLLIHGDEETCRQLNVEALPAAVFMLEQGPCGGQQHALSMLTTLSSTDAGLTAILKHHQLLPYVISAMVDSQCRKVREKAVVCLASVLATQSSNLQKSILDHTYDFFSYRDAEASEENKMAATSEYTPLSPPFATKTKLQMAISCLAKSFCAILHRDAGMSLTGRGGRVCGVSLTPGLDVDATLLSTLTHTTIAAGNLLKFSVNKVKTNVDVQGVSPAQWKDIKRKFHTVNHNIAKQMVTCGLLCMLDLLHAYTTTLSEHAESVQSLPAAAKGKNHVRRAAWGQTTKPPPPAAPKPRGCLDLASVFADNELQLVCSLLETIGLFSSCSCAPIRNLLHDDAQRKMSHAKAAESPTPKISTLMTTTRKFICIHCGRHLAQASMFDSGKTKTTTTTALNECEKCKYRKNLKSPANGAASRMSEDVRKMDELYKAALERDLHALNRHMRLSLMQDGVVEAVSAWLMADHWVIQSQVLEILTHLVQPVEERLKPASTPPGFTPSLPASTMTPQQRDASLRHAMSNMSVKVRTLVKSGLEGERRGNSNKNAGKHNNNKNKSSPVKSLGSFSSPNSGGSASSSLSGCVHDEPCLMTRSMSPLIDSMTREEINAEYKTIAEDLEEAEHPIDFIGDRCSSGEAANNGHTRYNGVNVRSVDFRNRNTSNSITKQQSHVNVSSSATSRRPTSASSSAAMMSYAGENLMRARPTSCAAVFKHNDYQNYARSRSNRPSFASSTRRPVRRVSDVYSLSERRKMYIPGKVNTCTKPQDAAFFELSPTLASCKKSPKPSSASRPSPQSDNPCNRQVHPDTQGNNAWVSLLRQSNTEARQPKSTSSSHKNSPYKPLTQSAKTIPSKSPLTKPKSTNIKKPPMLPKPKSEGWKTKVQQWRPLVEQCHERIVDKIGSLLVSELFSKKEAIKVDTLEFLHQYVMHGQSSDAMKMSEVGIIPSIVSFLRVHDDHPLLAIMCLSVMQSLVSTDTRLHELFNINGGRELLVTMATYSHGALKSELINTLENISNKAAMSGASSSVTCVKDRHAQSTRGQRRHTSAAAMPTIKEDIWTQILKRWKQEDEVQRILQSFN